MVDFKKIGIIGIGLIGGSIGLEIKRKKIAEEVIGYSRKMETMERAVEKGIIDRYYDNPDEVIKSADFLIIATPVNIIEKYIKIVSEIKPEIFFTDVASVKKIICEKVENIIGKKTNFIGSHPISGSEKSGIEAAKEGLFENKVVIITPTENTNKKVKEKVKIFWEKLGSKVIEMSPEKHDEILGFTSHLPHFLIYVLLYLGFKNNKKIFKNCFGSGFLDTTRIGKSNCEMWVDIFISNKKNLLKWIEKYEKELKNFKDYLRKEKTETLIKLFENSRLYREKIENGKKRNF
jgi:prephenate dehydrogenase